MVDAVPARRVTNATVCGADRFGSARPSAVWGRDEVVDVGSVAMTMAAAVPSAAATMIVAATRQAEHGRERDSERWLA